MAQEAVYALLLSVFAGLATGIGSFVAFFAKSTNRRFLSFSLGLSAGVMIYVSFMEMLFGAKTSLSEMFGARLGSLYTAVSLFGGIALAAIIDRLVPDIENPHELHSVEEMDEPTRSHHKLRRMGILTALAIAIHNFPEGIATFMSGFQSVGTGIAIALAVAIHNIPEGIAVSVPIYASTGSRRKAFWLSFASGLAEPVGALVCYAILLPFMSQVLLELVFAAIAGIMIYISLDELLPAAREYGENHIAMYGLVTGMVVMALSLVLLA